MKLVVLSDHIVNFLLVLLSYFGQHENFIKKIFTKCCGRRVVEPYITEPYD